MFERNNRRPGVAWENANGGRDTEGTGRAEGSEGEELGLSDLRAARVRREPTERMWRIHELLAAGKYPNCFSLSTELEVSYRTVKRDIDYMRDHFDLPIAYDARRRGFYYTELVRRFPGAGSVAEAELFAVVTGHHGGALCVGIGVAEVGDYEVVLEFDEWATRILRGRRWGAGQEFVETAGGSSRLRFRVRSLEEVERWVLSWGTHVTVIGPRALAERLRETMEAVVRKYAA